MLAGAFASIAAGISAQFGGPYHAAVARWSSPPVLDDGGSIVTPGAPSSLACQVQVDSATDAMRADAGFIEGDVRLLVLGLIALPTDREIEVTAGPHAGLYALQAVTRDPLGVGFECRGRRVD